MDNGLHGAENRKLYFGTDRDDGSDEFRKLTTDHLFGRIYGRANDPNIRGQLVFRDRALVNVALLAALGRDRELATHLQAAEHHGFTRDHLTEIMIHVAHYAGWPAGHNGMRLVAEHFKR